MNTLLTKCCDWFWCDGRRSRGPWYDDNQTSDVLVITRWQIFGKTDSQLAEFGAGGQSLSLPDSVHIWAAATSGAITAANKRHVGQADDVMTEHAEWINAPVHRRSRESCGGPLRLKEDIKHQHSSEERMNLREQGQLQMDFDLRHKQTFAVFIFCLRSGSFERCLSDNRWPIQPLYFSVNV